MTYFKPVLDVTKFGAKGNGMNDDVAAIQAAINALPASGGTIFFPPGTYRLIQYLGQAGGGVFFHLWCAKDNVTFEGSPGALLEAVYDATNNRGAKVFLCGGQGKNGAGMVDWFKGTNNFHLFTGQSGAPTVYALNGPHAKGVTQLTLTSAAAASNFAQGDYIYIRTGQCVANTAGHQTEPDSEINQVQSVSGAVLTLKYPTAKPYQQEYYIAGNTSPSSPTGTGAALPFGVEKVTDRVQKNLTFRNLRFRQYRSDGTGAGDGPTAVDPWQVDGFRMENCETENLGLNTGGTMRHVRVRNNRVRWNSIQSHYIVPGAVGMTDVIYEGNIAVNPIGPMQIHCHEGAARIVIRNNHIQSNPSGEYLGISLGARCYDQIIDGNIVESTSATSPVIKVYEGSPDGGIICNNTVICPATNTSGIVVNSPGWLLSNNKTPSYNVAAPCAVTPVTLTARVNKNVPTETLGLVPAGAHVHSVVIFLDQPFNGDGNNRITVGYDTFQNYFAQAINASIAGEQVAQKYASWVTAARTAKVYYTYDGISGPNVGYATVALTYSVFESPYAQAF